MNKKRKILTLVALVVFAVIIALHGVLRTGAFYSDPFYGKPLLDYKEAKLAVFVLAVFYAGLFAVLGDNKRKEQ